MKLILHLGMPKTGSTSIQTFLSKNRKKLLKLGILYPNVNISTNNHNFLSLFLNDQKSIPRRYRAIYKNNTVLMKRDAEKNWKLIKNQIDKVNPEIVILSGEAIFKGFENVDKISKFKERLLQITNDIEIVVYVRQPSKQYISHVQQRLKASGSFPYPQPFCIQEILQNIESSFERKIKVLTYEREVLYKQDVVSDFINQTLPEYEATLDHSSVTVANESISVESMSILQDYRMENHPEKDNLPTIDTFKLLKVLRNVERKYKIGNRPKLREQIANFIDYSSTDLLYLNKNYNVHFSGIDLNAIKAFENNPYVSHTKVSDICLVDDEVKKKILMLVIYELSQSDRGILDAFKNWISRYQGSFIIQLIVKTKSFFLKIFRTST